MADQETAQETAWGTDFSLPPNDSTQKFTEPVALSSTLPADLPVARTALELSFDLLALRARCKSESRDRGRTGQEHLSSVPRNLRTNHKIA